MVRVCVIGAGPSGTAALRAFKSAADKGAQIPEIVCYEKQADLGGLWNYSWRTGLDANSEPVHNSMYRYLWSNGPKECLEFADYTFEEHFGKPIPSYPPREVLHDYIRGRIDKSGIRKWIQCNTAVRNVTYDEATSMFTVVTQDLAANEQRSEEFDYVMCCTGHFSTPNVPEFEGFDKFQGRILHAHDFRDAVEMAGRNILIIGTSYSAEDIASQCYKYGVKSVTLSWRTAPMGFHWPDNFTTVSLLTKVVGKTCHFKDGETAEIDDIILCTGYKHHFPFIEPSLRLETANRLWVDSLHKGIFWPTNHKMMYLGMQDQWFTFNMFDAQAWFARDVVMGKIELNNEELDKEWAAWREREGTLEGDEANIRFQADMVQMLIDQTDYPSFNIEGVVQEFLQWEEHKHHDIMAFRDHPHKSVMTGTVAPVHHTKWLEALDDSMECYLKN